jgi:hypothetical protein
VAVSTPDSAYLARSASRSCTSLTAAAAVAAFDALREDDLRGVHVEGHELLGIFHRDRRELRRLGDIDLVKSANCSVAEYMVFLCDR